MSWKQQLKFVVNSFITLKHLDIKSKLTINLFITFVNMLLLLQDALVNIISCLNLSPLEHMMNNHFVLLLCLASLVHRSYTYWPRLHVIR
jgi:hypothetical protein